MLQNCLAVKPQKRFAAYKTSPNFLSAWGRLCLLTLQMYKSWICGLDCPLESVPVLIGVRSKQDSDECAESSSSSGRLIILSWRRSTAGLFWWWRQCWMSSLGLGRSWIPQNRRFPQQTQHQKTARNSVGGIMWQTDLLHCSKGSGEKEMKGSCESFDLTSVGQLKRFMV